MLELAKRSGRTKGSSLAVDIGTTQGFLNQVMSPLVRRGWVRSDPGPTGGYSADFDPERVSVLAVIEAIEGPVDTGRCVLSDRECSETQPCALHRPWSNARAHLLEDLGAHTLASLLVDEAQ